MSNHLSADRADKACRRHQRRADLIIEMQDSKSCHLWAWLLSSVCSPVDAGDAGDDVKVEGNLLKIRKSPGFVLGDLALLFNSPRSASIVAVTNIKMWAMDRRTFLKVGPLALCSSCKPFHLPSMAMPSNSAAM